MAPAPVCAPARARARSRAPSGCSSSSFCPPPSARTRSRGGFPPRCGPIRRPRRPGRTCSMRMRAPRGRTGTTRSLVHTSCSCRLCLYARPAKPGSPKRAASRQAIRMHQAHPARTAGQERGMWRGGVARALLADRAPPPLALCTPLLSLQRRSSVAPAAVLAACDSAGGVTAGCRLGLRRRLRLQVRRGCKAVQLNAPGKIRRSAGETFTARAHDGQHSQGAHGRCLAHAIDSRCVPAPDRPF